MSLLEIIRVKRVQFEILGGRFIQGEQANCEIRAHARDCGEGKTSLLLVARFFENHPNPPFRLEVAVEGIFVLDKGLTSQELAQGEGPSIIFPYLRDEVAHLTQRAGLPPLILPPFKLNAPVQIRDDLN